MANVDELLSSLISDIHTYTGKDPLLPWLRYPSIPSLSLFLCFPLNFSVYSLIIPNFTCSAIRKVKDTLPPKTLKEKLPAFLQKCAHTFELDRRYRNDMRYLRIWLHLVNQALFPSLLVIWRNEFGKWSLRFFLYHYYWIVGSSEFYKGVMKWLLVSDFSPSDW